MIVVIPRTWPQSNSASEECDEREWLPRTCPRCAQVAVVGHGRRWKSAHDQNHTRIRVRRGLCNHCELTITVLPAWSLPHSHYSLAARADSLQRLVEQGAPLEQSAPLTRDPNRVADPATVRRWLQRRLAGVWTSTAAVLRWSARAAAMLAPTIFAWDPAAIFPILMPEPTLTWTTQPGSP
jgi:hypothetical protein